MSYSKLLWVLIICELVAFGVHAYIGYSIPSSTEFRSRLSEAEEQGLNYLNIALGTIAGIGVPLIVGLIGIIVGSRKGPSKSKKRIQWGIIGIILVINTWVSYFSILLYGFISSYYGKTKAIVSTTFWYWVRSEFISFGGSIFIIGVLLLGILFHKPKEEVSDVKENDTHLYDISGD